MQKTLILFISLFSISIGYSIEDVSVYLDNRISKSNQRHETFSAMLNLMQHRHVTTIVETGTSRCGDANFDGDGGSTIIFAHWAQDHAAKLFSVDINLSHIEAAKNASIPYLNNIHFVQSDSVTFLKNFPYRIDSLYLDSWDYDYNDPYPAQKHCLNEVKAAYDKLGKNSIIMIDDCNILGGGKGLLAVQFLVKKKWKLYRNKHQVILIQKHS